MSNFPTSALILAFLVAAGLVPQAQSQTNTAKKSMTNSVSGRVTIHGKGAPGITVGIQAGEAQPWPAVALKGTTDQDGRYRIDAVPAGNYRVFPLAPAYPLAGPNPTRDGGKTLLLTQGEDVEGIDFSLIRGGVITGKVTDADGRLAIEERVMLLPDTGNTDNAVLARMIERSFQTDDRGIFRIYGIPPGRYKVFAGVSEEGESSYVRPGRVAYRRTFHPDTVEPGEARVIEVTEGSETKNIDISLGRDLPRFAASGKVVEDETAAPVAGWRFGVRRASGGGAPVAGLMGVSDSQGGFRLENIPPGKYLLFSYGGAGTEVRAEPMPFEIVDQDVTGLLLKTVKGVAIIGNVVLEGTGDKSTLAKLAELRVQVYVRAEGSYSSSWRESQIGTDGSFRLGGLAPGVATFALTGSDRGPARNFSILRVERDGVVLPRGLELGNAETTTGVKLVLGYASGTIRGQVNLGDRSLPQGWNLSVWIRKTDAPDLNGRPQPVDSRGRFLIEGVAAGSYELEVRVTLPTRRVQEAAKQLIDVADGQVTDVSVSLDVKAILGQTPIP
jgi:hypothetical protein